MCVCVCINNIVYIYMKLYISLFKENIIYQNYNEMFKYKIKFKLNIYQV